MADLTAARNTASRTAGLAGYAVKAATTVYKGGLVCLGTADGLLVPADDAASLSAVVGVSESTTTGGEALVRSGRAFRVKATSITQAMVGDLMHVVDGETIDDGGGTNSVEAGVLQEYISATEGWLVYSRGWIRGR